MPMPPERVRVLVVEDDASLREQIVRSLGEWGFPTSEAWSGEEAVQMNDAEPFDIAVLDYHLPRLDGLATLARLRDRAPRLQALMLTGSASVDLARRAIHLDVVEFLTKPAHRGELEQAIGRALQKRAAADQGPALALAAAKAAAAVPLPAAGPSLEDAERHHILATLRQHGGNRTAASRALGITRRTLHNKLRTYRRQGIDLA